MELRNQNYRIKISEKLNLICDILRQVFNQLAELTALTQASSKGLRQEMKGMIISGIVGKTSRSHSSSSPATRHTRSLSLSPQKRQLCNDATLRSPKDKTPTNPPSSATSHTSASSVVTKLARNTLERPKTTTRSASRSVIDTRSKTLNTFSQPCPAHEVFDMIAKTGKRPAVPNRMPLSTPSSKENYCNAYGKPLVTNFTKKLTIRKGTLYTPPLRSNGRDMSPPVHSLRSKELGNTKTPTKNIVSENKLRATNTKQLVLPNCKTPVITSSFGTKASKLTALSTNQSSINRTYMTKDAEKKPLHSNISQTSNELKKQSTINKELFHSTRTRTIMRSSIKGYKPQLEDIKSSYLLLNNADEDVNGKLFNNEITPKPRPINEELRRQQLLTVKKKFQSKKFWNESKYEKIEGLNWISWK